MNKYITPEPLQGFQTFQVGKRFPLEKYIGLGDLTISVFNTASFDIVVSFVDPSPEEIELFRKGELEIGFFNYKDIPFIYLDFRKYSVDVSLNINKLNEKDMDAWLNAEGNTIHLYLIDGNMGILKAQRMLGLNFMEDIRDTLEKQTELTQKETDALITEATNRFLTTQMQKQATKKMIFRR